MDLVEQLLWPGLGTGALAAVLGWVTARFLVPRLPEPPLDPQDDFVKPPYASLVGPPVVVPALVAGFVAGVVAPVAGALIWAAVALAGVGAALVVVDAHTTYLPARLHWLTTAITVVAALVGVFVVADSARWLPMLAGALFGAVASYALFWFISWIGQGFGYGDVRLAALVGGFAGALGIQQWWMALLSAAIIGAGLAIGVSLWRRRHPSPLGTAFAYGPALWAGPFVMLGLEFR